MRFSLILALVMLPCLPLCGCSNAEKPIDNAQLEKEFNELQKNRQKEDPFAGKRK